MLLPIFILLYTTFTQKTTWAASAIENFTNLVNQPFFVDKSEFIKTFFEEENKHVFITAPRGFGKTTNLQMLRTFCEIELDPENDNKPKHYTKTIAHQTFRNLKISNYTDIVETHMAQHVVIYIDLETDATMGDTIDYKKSVNFFNKKLYQSLAPYKWLLKGMRKQLDSFVQIVSPRLIDMKKKLNYRELLNEGDSNQTTLTLYDLANITSLYFGKDVIILIDNYDSVLNNFFKPTRKDIQTFYEYVGNVLCDTFDNEFPVTSYGLIKGTSSLVLPHVLLTLSKARHYNFLSDHRYTTFYGFTDPETTNLLLKYSCSIGTRRQVRKYYNGYKSKTKMITIYNPSSIVKYLANIDDPEALKPYRNVTDEDLFLFSFKEEKVFLHLIENLLNNMTANFDQYESFSMQNFTTFFNKCESYQYKAAEVEMMFSYIFDQGYLSHGIDDQVPFKIQNKEDSIVHVFATPNLEVWANVRRIAQVISESNREKGEGDDNGDEATKLLSKTEG